MKLFPQQLDDEERQQMAEGQGLDSEEYRRFIQQPSGNMDDTGVFSVQVHPSSFYPLNVKYVFPVGCLSINEVIGGTGSSIL